jgi:iron complex outermembrane receptor protein
MSALLLASILAVAAPLPAAAQEVHAFNVSATDPASAIRAFGVQAGLQILASADDLRGKKLNPVSGKISTEQALNDLLAGTGLDHRYVGDRAVALVSDSTAIGAEQNQAPQGAKDTPAADAVDTKNTRSDKFRLAQVDQGQTSSPATVERQDQQASKKKIVVLEEVVVTGSRIPQTARIGAQEVKVYAREQIEQSGQTTIADFLNTLPDVSVSVTERGLTAFGSTTVKLHGLPIGSTLVLLNGRRVETSGAQASSDFFDLNNIPVSAIERIEVVSEGSSAVYGSDAIAGVVNIILKKDFDGVEANAKYGWASGTDESDVDIAWGKRWERGGVSILGSYQNRSELQGTDRSITASDDHVPQGGLDRRTNTCSPGNIFSINGSNLPGINAPYAAVPSGFTGTPSISEFSGTAGTLNSCSHFALNSLIPETRRTGVLASGDYDISSAELFAEMMYAHTEQFLKSNPPGLFGQPGFQSFTASSSNPFNPFGETVGVSDQFDSLGRICNCLDTKFFRALVGVRGNFFDRWKWELAAWDSQDRSDNVETNFPNFAAIQTSLNSASPGSALNPFVDGPGGSTQLLQSFVFGTLTRYSGKTQAVNGFIRGPVLELPSGPIALVLGGEYDRDTLYSDEVNDGFDPPNTQATYHRDSRALFAEGRVPLLGNRGDPQAGDRLALTVAVRYDRYSDFGSKTTPQYGAEWRPFHTLLIRGSYAKAFKAPTLLDLHSPVTSSQQIVLDPRMGNASDVVLGTFGGNTQLQPETGQSRTFGFTYFSATNPDLRFSVTRWAVDESNNIQQLALQTIVDNESLFPGNVIRNSAGVITQVKGTLINFGDINVAGIDYQVNYRHPTLFGELLPSLSVTQTYHYSVAFVPGAAATDRVSIANNDGNWAPRWKGTVAMGWKSGPYTANIDGRYVGKYQDYGSSREIGNFWLCDANLRYSVGHALSSPWLKGVSLEVGGVNIFNRLPQFSNAIFGFVGYDVAEADIRGRFLYARISGKW